MKKIIIPLLFFVTYAIGQLPETFDLRDYNGQNYVSSIKSQKGGTCWTHGTMAAVEGNLLINGNWDALNYTNEPNMAEYHLDWWNGFNQNFNQDLSPTNGSGLQVHMGGDYKVSTAYFARGDGPIIDTTEGYYYGSVPHLYSDNFEYFYVRDVEWYSVGQNLEHINFVKQRLMENGVMGTCMAYDNQYISYSYIHYEAPDQDLLPNHSVAIVGWNDTLVTQAPLPGAWLCKNSWGTDWGNDGYFWISYYDKWTGKEPEMGAVSFKNTIKRFFNKIYYHDYHGWRDVKTDASEAFNAFTAEDSLHIKSVSFYTAEDSVEYTVAIYSNFSNNNLSNQLISDEGSISYKGFHTIDLSDSITLNKNDKFYIYLKLSKGGQPFDRTSEVPVLLGGKNTRTIVKSSASPGESYYKDSLGNWVDFYNEGDELWVHTGNFCMKAVVNQYNTDSTGINNTEYIQNGIKLITNPVKNVAQFRIVNNNVNYNHINIYDVSGRLIKSININTKNSIEIDMSSCSKGLYLYNVMSSKGNVCGKIIKQ